jgi:RIO-like serine/threonine protein kinase
MAPALRQIMLESKLLKKDIFGEVRYIFDEDGATIVRNTRAARVWVAWLARALMRREARILSLLDDLPGTPVLVSVTRDQLTRDYIPGRPMQEAKPRAPAYFRNAARLLRELHRRGVVHNDLAKEPNLLVTSNGQPAFVDFQIAIASPRRGRLFRTLAYDDLRHLLKHKRTYCPQALTQREQRILQNPSLPAKIWMRTGKPIYLFITRRILGWADREGAADRQSLD